MVNFGSKTSSGSSDLRECVKTILLEAGSIDGAREFIDSALTALDAPNQIGGAVGDSLNNLAVDTNIIAENIKTFREGLPLSDVLPSSEFGRQINASKTALEILDDLASRCTDFVLNELDKIDPVKRLEQLLDLAKDLCNQLNFTDLRKVIDKIEETKKDIVTSVIDDILDPAEKILKLNDMMNDAVVSGAQDAIENIAEKIEDLKYDQLYGYLNSLDPNEAAARLQAEIKKRSQIGDLKGVRDALDALTAINAGLDENLDELLGPLDEAQAFIQNNLPPIPDLLELPQETVSAIQDKIDTALDLGQYEEIDNVLVAADNLHTQLLSTLQDLDPSTLLQKGTTLLNEALQNGDIGQYTSILDEMAQKLCTQAQSDSLNIPTLPNVPNVDLPSILQ